MCHSLYVIDKTQECKMDYPHSSVFSSPGKQRRKSDCEIPILPELKLNFPFPGLETVQETFAVMIKNV